MIYSIVIVVITTGQGVKKGSAEQCQLIGSLRSGLTTKIHATADAPVNPTGFRLMPRQAHGVECADMLLKDTQAGQVIADKVNDVQARLIEPLRLAGRAMVFAPICLRRHQRSY